MSMLTDKGTNAKFFLIASLIGIVNQSLLPFLDKDYIQPHMYQMYVSIQIFSVIFLATNLIVSKIRGYTDLYLHLFMGYMFVWGSICQFMIPSAYLTYIICLFSYAGFLRVKNSVFLMVAVIAFSITGISIILSDISYSNEIMQQEKFKADAIQTLIILSLFIWLTQITRNRERQRTELIESKLFNLGSQAAGILHDLKSQIMPPLNYSKMLQNFNLDVSDQKEISQELNESLEAMRQYVLEVNQMFSFKKEIGKVNLQEMIDNLKVVLQFKIKNITFEIEQDGELEVSDLIGFKSMLYNLIINSCEAFKNGNECKRISISIKNNIFQYQDNAGGMPDDVLAKIKNKIFTSSKKNGSGLGMFFITKYIEDNSNWKLYLSNKDHGFNLSVYIHKENK